MGRMGIDQVIYRESVYGNWLATNFTNYTNELPAYQMLFVAFVKFVANFSCHMFPRKKNRSITLPSTNHLEKIYKKKKL
jgi:hypothetical protein